MRRVCAVTVCGLALAVFAGCGSNGRLSADDYQAALTKVGHENDFIRHTVARDMRNAKTVPEFLAAIRRYADAREHVGDELARLKPPADAAAANAELAKGMRDQAMEYRASLPKLEKYATIQQLRTGLNRIGRKGVKEQTKAFAKLLHLDYSYEP